MLRTVERLETNAGFDNCENEAWPEMNAINIRRKQIIRSMSIHVIQGGEIVMHQDPRIGVEMRCFEAMWYKQAK